MGIVALAVVPVVHSRSDRRAVGQREADRARDGTRASVVFYADAVDSAAAARWADRLARWAIPDAILAQAPVSPWQHDTAMFAVDDTLDRRARAAEIARAVLPARGGSVLDVGCGGGRAAMSLVPPAEEVIGVDQSPAMLTEFTRAAGVAGVRATTVEGRWPDVADITPVADVVVCHHVAYNVADI
jgi:2-polyprenyl-3-methyl-5-hydroxy-6-metoxy-1,4-benzoquinol methylase